MSILIPHREIWTRQPQVVTGVRTDSELGVPALAWHGAFPHLNLANRKPVVTLSGASRVPGARGFGARFASSTNNGIKIDGPSLLSGANGNYVTGLTVYVLADPPNNSTRSIAFSFSDNATQPQAYLAFNTAVVGTTVSAGRFSVTDGANGAYIDGKIDGKPHIFACVMTGGFFGPDLYVDGVNTTTGVSELGAYAASGQDIWIGGYSSGSWAASDYSVYAVLAFNRNHTPKQVAQVSANIWQFFEPEETPVLVALGAAAYTLTAATGAFTLTGNAAGLKVDRKLTAESASFALTGNTAALVAARKLVADVGAYSLIGNAAGLIAARNLVADSASYTLTGNAATLTYAPSGAYTLTAESGAFALTGNAAQLTYSGAVREQPAGRPSRSRKRNGRRRVIIGDTLYDVPDRDIPALLEAAMLDRKPPSTAKVVIEQNEQPKPDQKPARKAAKAHEPTRWAQPTVDDAQARYVALLAQINAQAEADVRQMLDRVAERVLLELADEEDALVALLLH